jgi:hypothetical protein
MKVAPAAMPADTIERNVRLVVIFLSVAFGMGRSLLKVRLAAVLSRHHGGPLVFQTE